MSDPTFDAPSLATAAAAGTRARPDQNAAALANAERLLGEGRTGDAIDLLWRHTDDRACGDLLREYYVGERMHEELHRLLARRASASTAPGLVDQAISAHLRGDIEGATRLCRLAIATDPRDAPAHNHLGRALFNAGRADMARAEFLHAVRIARNYPEAWHNLAHVLRDARELEQSEHAYGHALRMRPAFRSAMFNRGILRIALGSYKQALDDFRRVLAMDPTHAEACLDIAVCQHLLGRYDAAMAACDHAIMLDPGNASAYVQSGRIHAEVSDIRLALAQFQKALELDPHDTEAWGEVAMLHERANRLDEAEHAITAGLAIAVDDIGLRLERANIARRRGDFAEALSALRAIEPEKLPRHLRLRYEKVLDLADTGIAGNP